MSIVASLGGSLVLGVGALVAARFWAPPPAKPAQVAQVRPQANMKPVVVASQALAYGTKLDPGKLVVRYVPSDAVPEGAFTSIDEVMARDAGAPLILTPVAEHETLLPSKVSGPGARPSVATQISDGMRAYSVPVTDKSSVGGNALPGDWVDVVLAKEFQPQGGGQQQVTAEVVLQNVRVLGMDRNANPSSTETAVASTATLEVRLQDVQKLSMAQLMGTLSLALRKPGSAEVEQVHLIRATNAGGLSADGIPQHAAARPVIRSGAVPAVFAAAPPAPSSDSTISIRSGDQKSQVTVPHDRSLIVLGAR